MRFATTTAAVFLSVLSGLSSAQTPGFDAITAPNKDQNLTAGETTTVAWDYDAKWPGDITITLIGGSSSSMLSPVSNLTEKYDNSKGTYTWKVDKSLGDDAVYGLQIFWNKEPSVFQWSEPFHITAQQ